MNSLIQSLQGCMDTYRKYLKQVDVSKNMTPKEYGMHLAAKRRKGKRGK